MPQYRTIQYCTVVGETGVSVDELVGLWVPMGRKTEAERKKRAAGERVPGVNATVL